MTAPMINQRNPTPADPRLGGRPWGLRLASLSVLLFVILAGVLAYEGGGGVHESAFLLTVLNTLFGGAVSLLIAHLAGTSYLATGARSHLYLSAGSLAFAVAYLLAGPLLHEHTNLAIALHNTGVLLAGACFLLSARRAMGDHAVAQRTRWAPLALLLALAVPVVLMGLVLWGAAARVIPEFYAAERGMTPLRNVIIIVAVDEFLLAAAWFGALNRRAPSAFLGWYAHGLALIGFGLAAVALPAAMATPLGWLGRVGQYLGCLYLLRAVFSVERESGHWRLPLEEALRDRDIVFSSFFDLFAVGMVLTDPVSGRFTRVNARFCEITGYSREELLGMTVQELTCPEDREKDAAAIARAVGRETPGWTSVKRYRRKDGSPAWVQVTGNVVFDGRGRPARATAVVEDVSERIRAQEERERLLAEVQRTAGELNAVFQTLPILTCVVGADGRHERANPAMVRLFGFDPAATPPEVVAHRLDARLPDGTPLTLAQMPSSRALRGERVNDVEYEITAARGERRTLLATALPLYSGENVYGALLTERDVTEERLAARQIGHLASFPALNPSPVVECDFAGAATYVNPSAQQALRELGKGDDASAFLPADIATLLEATLRGEGQAAQTRRVSIGDRVFDERIQVLPELGVMRIYARDLTELMAIESERAHLFERLERARAESERKVQERTADLDRTVRLLQEEIAARIQAERGLRRGEEQLRASAAYARSLIDASLDPLAAITTGGTITDVNPAFENVTGLPRERLIGRDLSALVAEPHRARTAYLQAMKTGSSRDSLLTMGHADGTITEVLLNASVYRDAEGRIAGIFAAARDVTEQNASIRRLRVTSELLQLFQRVVSRQEYLDAVVKVIQSWSGCECVGIRIDDGAGHLSYEAQVGFDERFLETERCLSLERDDCVCTRTALGATAESDRPCLTSAGSFRCNDTPEFESNLEERLRQGYRGHCFRKGFASLAAIPIRYRDQTRGLIHLADHRVGVVPPATVEFLEYIVPLVGEAIHRYDTEAELDRHRAHLEDLVEHRTMELQHAAAELERSNRDLEQFASAVSHDLKEPLRAVAGYASLLRTRYGGRFDDKAASYLTGMVDGAERMQRLIDDLLAYSRIGSRGGELRPTDATAALMAAVANLRVAIEETGAVMEHDSLPTVRSDASQLVQLFQNLIANAVKFHGAETLRIHIGAEREAGQWRFSVRDNGIGIDPRFHKRIFEIFQRLHPRSAYPGTGIGLAICKRIVERHGGRIWVESEPGRGTTFFFTVPDGGGEAR